MATLNPSFVSQINSSGEQPKISGGAGYVIGKVTHIVYGPYLFNTLTPDPLYTNPTDIGKILFQKFEGTQNRTSNSKGNLPAKPVNSSVKQLPVEGELVFIIPGPGVDLNDNKSQQEYYYLNPFNLWGAANHNAFPDLGDYANYSNDTQRSYRENQATNQATNLSSTASVNYPLGNGFPEKTNVKSLEPFVGDLTIEGRWGNSIRFGSTSPVQDKDRNYWSSEGIPGSPITIIRNGQGRQLDNEGYTPTVENINRDQSSIYLTAGQKIVMDDINNNFSLASFQINLEAVTTNSIPIQQQLTSNESLSPLEQDKRISNNV